MSLLDDVSIVVTPNAYKAGRLYGVLPTAVEGSEIIQNVDFSSDTWWQKSSANVNISNGKGNYTAGTTEYFYKTNTLTVGKRYKLVYEITDYTTGNITAYGGNWSGADVAVGTYEKYFTCIDTTFGLVGNTFVGSIDNVTVKEVTNSDMDVTRATAATRVDENGLVNYAEVLGSELVTNGNFDSNITGWSAKDCTIVWDNGKLKADNSSGNANGGAFQNIGLVTGKEYKMTATMQLLTGSSNGTFTLFTSAAGGTGQTSVYTGSALVVGGAAVTETFYFTPGSGDVSIQFTCNEANATFTIDNVSVKEVTRNNVPRIDYKGGGCPHILAEPQRTNLMLYSEDFSSNWTTSNLSVVEHSTTSPSGETNADKLKEDSSNSTHTIRYANPNTPVTNGAVYTISFFAKKEERTSIRLSNAAMSNTTGEFNLSNGQVISSGSAATNSMVDYGNGWYRCIMTFTSSTTIAQANIAILNANNDITYQGDGSSGLYMWGVQIEEGSYPTSYIPTTSGSAVTRNKDLFTRDGISSLINSAEGVLFVEMAALADDLTFRGITISDGTYANRCVLRYGGASNKLNVLVSSGNSSVFDSSSTLSNIKNFNKIAVKWKANDFAFWVNGVEVATSTSGNAPIGLSQLQFGDSINSSAFLDGKVKQLQVYKTALTDEQLTSLTS